MSCSCLQRKINKTDPMCSAGRWHRCVCCGQKHENPISNKFLAKCFGSATIELLVAMSLNWIYLFEINRRILSYPCVSPCRVVCLPYYEFGNATIFINSLVPNICYAENGKKLENLWLWRARSRHHVLLHIHLMTLCDETMACLQWYWSLWPIKALLLWFNKLGKIVKRFSQ